MPETRTPPADLATPEDMPALTEAQIDGLERAAYKVYEAQRQQRDAWVWVGGGSHRDIHTRAYAQLVKKGLCVDGGGFTVAMGKLTPKGEEIAYYLFTLAHGYTPAEWFELEAAEERARLKAVAAEKKEIRALLRKSQLPSEIKRRFREAIAGDPEGNYDRIVLYRDDMLSVLRAMAGGADA